MLYLCWYDDTPKRTTADKIRAGCARYMERYDVAPNVVLINPTEAATVAGVDVRPTARIRPNNYHIGVEIGVREGAP